MGVSGNEHLVKHNILDFILGGNCTTTIKSEGSGVKYTYKIQAKLDDEGRRIPGDEQTYFVKIDIEYLKFIYAGYLSVNRATGQISYTQGNKGKYSQEAPPIKGLTWLIRRSLEGKSVDGLSVYHLGTCGKCGRALTDPISIETGLGPTCGKRGKR